MHVTINGKNLQWPRRPTPRLVKDEILGYYRGWIFSGSFAGENNPETVKFCVYSAQDLESATSELLPHRKVSVDRFGKYRITNAPGPALVKETLPLYIENEVSDNQRVKNDLRLVSIKEDELPVFHYYEGYMPEEVGMSTGHTNVVQGPDEEFLLMVNHEPETEGQRMDLLFERHQAGLDAIAAEDSKNKLRHKPDILPTNAAYMEAEAHFTKVLKSMGANKKTLIEIIEDEFETSQQLLLQPALDSPQIAAIQQENRVLYQQNLKSTFKGKVDNTITKWAMLRFGLPIAPLTKTNAAHAGTRLDVPGLDDKNSNANGDPRIEKISPTEDPLEFLDSYHTRHYENLLLRTPKHYNFDGRYTIETKIKPASKPSGDAETNLQNQRIRAASVHNDKSAAVSKSVRFAPSLRGGASAEAQIHTDMGIFNVSTSGKGLRFNLQKLAIRLFRIRGVVDIDIDVFPHNQQEPPQSRRHLSTDTMEDLDDTAAWLQTNLVDRHGEVDVRMRHAGAGSIDDSILLKGEGLDVVELQHRDTGTVAYWNLPLHADKHEAIVGVNKRYETFRNSIECLEVRDFQWTINEGQLDQKRGTVYGDAPAVDLWDAVLEDFEKMQNKSIDGRIRVIIDDFAKAEELRIIIPGVNHKNTVPSIPYAAFVGENAPNLVFKSIRDAVKDRFPYLQGNQNFQDLQILIWQGTVDYKRGQKPHILPFREHVSDPTTFTTGDWAGLVTEPPTDALVVLPDLKPFTIEDDAGSKLQWSATNATLKSFRETLVRLWPSYNAKKDSITIHQPHRLGANNEFLIDPEMDEARWNLQVFSWLCDKNIYVHTSNASSLEYSRPSIGGPLWTVTSGESNQPAGSSVRSSSSSRIAQPLSPVRTVRQNSQLQHPIPPGSRNGSRHSTANSPPASLEGSSTNAASKPSSLLTWLSWSDKIKNPANRQTAYTESQTIGGPSGRHILQVGTISGLAIRGGPQVPTSITTTMSRSQIQDLDKRVRSLQNIVLNRQTGCQICGATFSKGPPGPDEFKAHLQIHIDQLKTHRCPYCHLDDWRNWTDEERTSHIGLHIGGTHNSSVALMSMSKTCQFCQTSTENMSKQMLHDHYLNAHFSQPPTRDESGLCGFLMADGSRCQHNMLDFIVRAEIIDHYRSHLPCEHCGLPGDEIRNRSHHAYSHRIDALLFCTFSDCNHQFNGSDNEEVHHAHFRTHLPDVSAEQAVEVSDPVPTVNGDGKSDIDEEYSDDEIPEDAEDVAMPQRKIDEAEAVGRRWRCPHDANLVMRRGKMGKAPHNFIDQKHLHNTADDEYPRIESHSEWLLVGEGKEREELFAERDANRKSSQDHTPLKVTPQKATPKTKTPPKLVLRSAQKKLASRKQRPKSPKLAAGDGALDVEEAGDDEGSLAKSRMSTSTRSAKKRYADREDHVPGTGLVSSPSKRQKTVSANNIRPSLPPL